LPGDERRDEIGCEPFRALPEVGCVDLH
jgi:hypothetical protein